MILLYFHRVPKGTIHSLIHLFFESFSLTPPQIQCAALGVLAMSTSKIGIRLITPIRTFPTKHLRWLVTVEVAGASRWLHGRRPLQDMADTSPMPSRCFFFRFFCFGSLIFPFLCDYVRQVCSVCVRACECSPETQSVSSSSGWQKCIPTPRTAPKASGSGQRKAIGGAQQRS